jgi:hypothetical protein
MGQTWQLNIDIFGSSVPKLVTPLERGIRFGSGARITATLPTPLRFTSSHTQQKPPSAFEGHVVPTMSTELIQTLRRAGVTNLQCFPAEICSRKDGTVWTAYEVVNVVGLHACAAVEGTTSTHIMDGPGDAPPLVAIEQLKVDPQRAALGGPLFRLAEDPRVILVSEAVAGALRAVKSDEAWGLVLDQR